MVRKRIHADEGIMANGGKSGNVMTDIMFYLRKILKLARRAKALGLSEGADFREIEEEFEGLKKEIDTFLGA